MNSASSLRPVSRPSPDASRAFVSVWLAANAVDLLTTVAGLWLGLREVNVLPAQVWQVYGFNGLYMWKTSVTLAMAGGVCWLARFYPRVWTALRIGGWLVGVAAVVNLMHILGHVDSFLTL